MAKYASRFVNVPSLERMKESGIVKPELYIDMLFLMYQYGLLNMQQARELGVPETRWSFTDK